MATSIDASASLFHSNPVSEPQPRLYAIIATVPIISAVMTTPGRMPARNSAPIETFAIMP